MIFREDASYESPRHDPFLMAAYALCGEDYFLPNFTKSMYPKRAANEVALLELAKEVATPMLPDNRSSNEQEEEGSTEGSRAKGSD